MKIVQLDKIPNRSEEMPDNLDQIYNVCKQMHSLCSLSDGVGLSAFQVGIPWNLFVVRSFDGVNFCNFINCDYKNLSEDKFPSCEGCLSLPARTFLVKRYSKIEVVGQELIESKDGLKLIPYKIKHEKSTPSLSKNYQELNLTLTVFQHEIDHQFGRDRMIDKIGKEYFNMMPFEAFLAE